MTTINVLHSLTDPDGNVITLAGPVADYLNDLWDHFDPWGSAMAEGFALCDWLTFEAEAGAEIPEGLSYVPSLAGADKWCAHWEFVCEGYANEHFMVSDVVDYLFQLDHFYEACERAGVTY